MEDENAEHPTKNAGNKLVSAFAWLVILSVVGLIISLQMRRRAEPQKTGSDSVEYVMLEVQSKYSVGVGSLFGEAAMGPLKEQVKDWPTDTDGEGVRAAIVIGELIGAEEALERLAEIESKANETSDTATDPSSQVSDDVLSSLRDAYQDFSEGEFAAPSVSPEQRESILEELGWFGELALVPEGSGDPARERVLGSAKRIVIAILSVAVGWCGLGFLGLCVLIFTVLRLILRKEKRFDSRPRHGKVYVESFAIWIVSFVLLGFLAGVVFPPQFGMLGSLMVMGLSLGAVAWPCFRGVTWKDLRTDLGWTMGKGLIRESLAGIGSYTTALPLIVTAYVVTWLALMLFGIDLEFDQSSAHPIVQQQIGASVWTAVQLFTLACVMAPLLEETVFRGLLYRHLREASSRIPFVLSVLFSALVNAALFALIHPQGFVALPALGAIAVALSLSREYRDSLIAPILGHAINNTVTLCLLFTLFQS
ncbi:MAG: type II CAAX endopeptidase family protein [Planctomycetota bacterium]